MLLVIIYAKLIVDYENEIAYHDHDLFGMLSFE
jgi:hypothetical protein